MSTPTPGVREAEMVFNAAHFPSEVTAKTEYAKQCIAAMDGIESPAAFMAAVRELRDTVKREGLVEVCRSARKLIAMLPPETSP